MIILVDFNFCKKNLTQQITDIVNIYFLQFWCYEVQDQGTDRFNFW